MGRYILENSLGQVVRTFNWEADQVSFVYRQDTRRIVPVTQISDLEEQKIPFEFLKTVSKKEIEKGPVSIAKLGSVRYVPEVLETSPTIPLAAETNEKYK